MANVFMPSVAEAIRPPAQSGFWSDLQAAGVDASSEGHGYGKTAFGSHHEVAGWVRPVDATQVQALVQAANRHHVPLHPIARGKNWGYGSASPSTPGQVVVDLSRMNRILEVNEHLGYCVLEPGVSQGELAAYLDEHHPSLQMDATGAGPDASVVGNTLDRGFGHTRYGDHFATACGIEVVLGDGRVLRTGYGHFKDAAARHAYRYGLGPILDGLFSQSSFGIVTQIGLWLQPRPEYFTAFAFQAAEDHDLEGIVETVGRLRRSGLLQTAVHIANDLRVLSARQRYPWEQAQGVTPLPDGLQAELRRRAGIGAWNGLGALQGPKSVVKAAAKEIKRAFSPRRVTLIDDQRLALAAPVAGALKTIGLGKLDEQLRLVEPVMDLLKGRPNREHLKGVLWRVRGDVPDEVSDPLKVHAGLRWCSPMLPMTGQDARRCLDVMTPIYRKHGFDPLVTFTAVTERALVCVSNLTFDLRREDECAAASVCYRELCESLKASGYLPYRVSRGEVSELADPEDVFWGVVNDLKRVLDPANIISPGRYALTPPHRADAA